MGGSQVLQLCHVAPAGRQGAVEQVASHIPGARHSTRVTGVSSGRKHADTDAADIVRMFQRPFPSLSATHPHPRPPSPLSPV